MNRLLNKTNNKDKFIIETLLPYLVKYIEESEYKKETIEQAKNADLVIVVGGKHSANTTRLAQLCQGLTEHVQHVETAEELDPALIQAAGKIFITAGASTPSWVIEDVESRVKLISQD